MPSGKVENSCRYDVRGQLLEEQRNGTSVSYAYDKAGNRIKKTDAKGATLYWFNGKNQLIAEENNDGRNEFAYDRQGGIIEEKNPAGIRLFSYNSRHQQVKVETETGSVQENRYDVENLRFELLENEKRTGFVYHGGELLHEEGREEKQTSYHLGAGIDAIQRGQELSYYHRDEQFSTALITGRDGAVQNSYQYDAFGVELETNEQFPNRIRYTGQRYDELTEQYYLRARYYNPVLGRFMQEDTYQGDGLNLYAYCGNNPVVYYDPTGYAGNTPLPSDGCGQSGQIDEGKGEGANDDISTSSKGQEELTRTPAQEYADEVRNLPSSERPNVVAVIETPDGQTVKSHNAQGIQCDEVQTVLDFLGNENDFDRKCAEVNGVSIARNNGIDLEGATISVANVRGPNSTSGVHGTPKTPCNVCQPLLDFYGIEYQE